MLLRRFLYHPKSHALPCRPRNPHQWAFLHSTRHKTLFDDSEVAFAGKSTIELLRGAAVFKACSIRAFVDRADLLVSLSTRIFGRRFTNAIARRTFFAHFCGGETESSLEPVINNLWRYRVGAILDYAAEADLHEADAAVQIHSPNLSDHSIDSAHSNPDKEKIAYRLRRTRSGIHARTYDYVSEQLCDANVEIFEDCVRAVRNVSPNGFAAIKITALGNPQLLERVATMMTESRRLFDRMDRNNSGRLSRREFRKACSEFFDFEESEVDDLFDSVKSPWASLDRNEEQQIDICDWMSTIEPAGISQLVRRCCDRGALYNAALTNEELVLVNDLYARVNRIAALAKKLGVRLMVDAEQSYFQPAIDALVLRLQRQHNTTDPIIFNTYQCYLIDAEQRAAQDIERSRREGWRFAAKLVRGAYLVTERARAKEHGYPSPIHASLADTHASYNSALRLALDEVRQNGANVMVATHNQESCQLAVELMNEWDSVDSGEKGMHVVRDGVFFGQLLGMADHVTFILGHHGFKAFKYVPYGPVGEVMPYLIRRAQENSDVMGGAVEEGAMMWKEVRRRMNL